MTPPARRFQLVHSFFANASPDDRSRLHNRASLLPSKFPGNGVCGNLSAGHPSRNGMLGPHVPRGSQRRRRGGSGAEGWLDRGDSRRQLQRALRAYGGDYQRRPGYSDTLVLQPGPWRRSSLGGPGVLLCGGKSQRRPKSDFTGPLRLRSPLQWETGTLANCSTES
jgi:hypothetical protein